MHGCVVWDPHLLKDKTAIENVHKFALRVCSKQWRASYESLLTTFHAFSMSERRVQLKLLTLFNMVKGNIFATTVSIATQEYSICHQTCKSTSAHSPSVPHKLFQALFFPSAITCWNDLPFDTTELSSPAMFKRLIMQL